MNFDDAFEVKITNASVLALLGLVAELVYRLETSEKYRVRPRADSFFADALRDIEDGNPPFSLDELSQSDRDALTHLVDSLNFLVQGYHDNSFPAYWRDSNG